jgi:hypothetical protein
VSQLREPPGGAGVSLGALWRVDVDDGVGQAADVVQQVMSWTHHTDAVTLSETCW